MNIVYNGKLGAICFILVAICVIITKPHPGQTNPDYQAQQEAEAQIEKEKVKIVEVVDGDTIKVTGFPDQYPEPVTVRLIGIDTPESVNPDESLNNEYGQEASDYMKDTYTGAIVYLEYDEERTDSYGRTLAYVWYGNNMIQYDLLKKGYARVMYVKPNVRYHSTFLQYEDKARYDEAGFWADYFKES